MAKLIHSLKNLKIYKKEEKSSPIQFNEIMGLHFKNENHYSPNLSNDLTACVRFNYPMLGFMGGKLRPIILDIGNVDSPNIVNFLQMSARYPWNWINFRKEESNIGSSWILMDYKRSLINFFKPMVWHHVCFSFSKVLLKAIFAQVKYQKNMST